MRLDVPDGGWGGQVRIARNFSLVEFESRNVETWQAGTERVDHVARKRIKTAYLFKAPLGQPHAIAVQGTRPRQAKGVMHETETSFNARDRVALLASYYLIK